MNNQFLDGVELNPGECREAHAYGGTKRDDLVQVVPEDRDLGQDDGVEGRTRAGSSGP